jgi:hypothetical protein
MPRHRDRHIFHHDRSVDQPEVEIVVAFPKDRLFHTTDLLVQRAAHDQRIEVAEALAPQ